MEEAMQTLQPPTLTLVITKLMRFLHESERNLYTAAEQTENRGSKLLLKAYAQQRAYFARQLRALVRQLGNGTPDREGVTITGFLQRGWSELRAAMTVRRQFRQRLLLRDLLPHEEATVNAFVQAEVAGLPAPLVALLHQQQAELRKSYRRVELLVGQPDQHLVLRLFDQADAAHAAVDHLEQSGIAPDDIAVTALEALPAYEQAEEAQPRATREAIFTGTLLGLLAGALLGMIYGFFHITLLPTLAGFIATDHVGIVLEIMLYGALIGSFFSLIFSALISRNAAESDAYLSQASFQQGDRLVAVFAKPRDVSKVERIIGLRHEHEIEPLAA